MTMPPVILDAKGKALGRIASEAALYLRGKKDPAYQPYLVPKQKVIIKNAAEVMVTSKKMINKGYKRYSGYPGGLSKVSYKEIFRKNPGELLRRVVSGMVPQNRLKKKILKNLTVYASSKE